MSEDEIKFRSYEYKYEKWLQQQAEFERELLTAFPPFNDQFLINGIEIHKELHKISIQTLADPDIRNNLFPDIPFIRCNKKTGRLQ